MICPNCGKIYSDKKDSCPRCGMPRGELIDESKSGLESSSIERTPIIERRVTIENQPQGYRSLESGEKRLQSHR